MAHHAVMPAVVRTASFSRDRRFRYRLTRSWDTGAPALVWVMLNPSAADTVGDDPTTRRVMAFSREWSFGGCDVVNLFGLRSHRPRLLAEADDPVGPRNGQVVAAALRAAGATGMVVVGWGRNDAPGVALTRAATSMVRRIGRAGLRAVTLGHNADGSPRHPLYVPRTACLVDFAGRLPAGPGQTGSSGSDG